MKKTIEYQRILIFITLIMIALILGYNVFYVNQISPTVIVYRDLEDAPIELTESTVTTKNNVILPLNINTATVEQLQALPGIGQTYAERIVQYREENGGFKSINEIMLVKGIGEKIFEKIEPFIII